MEKKMETTVLGVGGGIAWLLFEGCTSRVSPITL